MGILEFSDFTAVLDLTLDKEGFWGGFGLRHGAHGAAGLRGNGSGSSWHSGLATPFSRVRPGFDARGCT